MNEQMTISSAINVLIDEGLNPTICRILKLIGVVNYTKLKYYDSSQGYSRVRPRVGECLEEGTFGFKIIAASKNRLLFSNGELYIVDSPFQGALYVFQNYSTAVELVTNSTSASFIKERTLKYIAHNEKWVDNLRNFLQTMQ
jgi:hypothetical protein